MEILALGDVELAVTHPVANATLVQAGQPGDVIERRFHRDAPPALADHEGDLGLVIELHRFRRAQDGLAMGDQRIGRAQKDRRI